MSKLQFVLEEALEVYLGQLQDVSLSNRAKVVDSILDLNTGILIGLKAARGEILKEEAVRGEILKEQGNVNTDKT